ncbi:MAG TPA: SH3 domain-containing protein [Anaerolineales bacterium]|nr:SH3 domain-containing protein [Anaerolineales bacterium]
MRLATIAFALLSLVSTGCSPSIREAARPSQTPFFSTATIPVTFTPRPSETALPPPPQPTTVSAEGSTSTQVNVRAEPALTSAVLGMLPANTKVEITGKDPGEQWWQINYPQGKGVDGKGWVTAQYVTTTTRPEVPTIGGDETNKDTGNVAILQHQLNVRSGPGTDFNSLGTLDAQAVVKLTGKDPSGAWLQIDFEAGPEGKGWVNAAFVQARGVENLPIITEAGQVVGTGTPTGIPLTPTPTLIPAWEDHDSADGPIASVIFEPAGTQTLIYNGELSSPEGDSQDWIAFKPYGRSVFLALDCKGNDSLKIEITENSLPTNLEVACGAQMREIPVNAGSNYVIHLQAAPSTGELNYINYVLKIKAEP